MTVTILMFITGGLVSFFIGIATHHHLYPFGESSIGAEAKRWRDAYNAAQATLDKVYGALGKMRDA